MFEKQKGDLDAYLARFERACKVYGVLSAEWSTQIGTSLGSLIQKVIIEFKLALLKRFQITEDGYKKMFDNSRIGVGRDAGSIHGETSTLFD